MKWKPNDPRYKNKGRLCDVPGCGKPFHSKGLCRNHYEQLLRNGFLASRVNIHPPCSVASCKNESNGSLGLCRFHYARKRLGIDLERSKGLKGELNPRWNGGTSEYKNHHEMKKTRKLVLSQENFTCFFCGKPTKQIHHIDGSKSNHERSNLHACCQSCNIKFAKSHKLHRSKYSVIYGKSLSELSRLLKININKLKRMHLSGQLRKFIWGDEVDAVLF